MHNEWYIYGNSSHGRFGRAFPIAGERGYSTGFEAEKTVQSRHLKHKQYELKDHLGNVRVIVSDFKMNNQTAHSNPPYYADVLSVYNYYPFGMLQPGMYFENEDPRTRFGFNGMLRDDDIKDKFSTSPDDEGRGNSYATHFRMYDPRVARWFSIDPLVAQFPWTSPYTAMGNNPVSRIDPLGNADYYSDDGTYRGNDNVDDNRTMLSQGPVEGPSPQGAGDNWRYQQNSMDLGIKHNDFVKDAATIYGESSVGYGIVNKEEIYGIASAYQRNRNAYGFKSAKGQEFMNTPKEERSGAKSIATAALINALTGGFDYSYGADQWDGIEQARIKRDNLDKASVGGFMYKMNTMGWSIKDSHYQSWKNAIDNRFGAGSFTVPQEKTALYNYGGKQNKGRIRLNSTAQYGLTIFWKTTK